MLTSWLNCARTTDEDLKKAFMVSLTSLLKMPKDLEQRDKCNEIVRRLWSNLTSPTKFPDYGIEHQSVEYLVKNADVPFEDLERTGLKVIKQLITWEWGMRSFYGSSLAVSYILNRGAHKAKDILETKYRIV